MSAAIRDGMVLVIGCCREDRAYCVLPGGGAEPGEASEVAVLRELEGLQPESIRDLVRAVESETG